MLNNVGLPGLFIVIAFLVVNIIAFWKLFEKSGSPGAWSLLGLIPGVQLILLWVVAFKKWPTLEKTEFK